MKPGVTSSSLQTAVLTPARRAAVTVPARRLLRYLSELNRDTLAVSDPTLHVTQPRTEVPAMLLKECVPLPMHLVNLLADQPYWMGEVLVKSWSQGDLRQFYITEADRVTYGYPEDAIYYLSQGGALDTATFTNDGDVPAYPTWTVTGPTTAVSFGVGGNNIIVPFDIPAGHAVQLDTDPVSGQVLWFGPWDAVAKKITAPVDRTKDLSTGSAFVAIPRGENRPLSIQMTGTGTVTAEVRSRHRRAW